MANSQFRFGRCSSTIQGIWDPTFCSLDHRQVHSLEPQWSKTRVSKCQSQRRGRLTGDKSKRWYSRWVLETNSLHKILIRRNIVQPTNTISKLTKRPKVTYINRRVVVFLKVYQHRCSTNEKILEISSSRRCAIFLNAESRQGAIDSYDIIWINELIFIPIVTRAKNLLTRYLTDWQDQFRIGCSSGNQSQNRLRINGNHFFRCYNYLKQISPRLRSVQSHYMINAVDPYHSCARYRISHLLNSGSVQDTLMHNYSCITDGKNKC